MEALTPLNKTGNYIFLASLFSFKCQRRTRSSQGLQQQTQPEPPKQPPQLLERQSARAHKLLKEPYFSDALHDDSMTKTSRSEMELSSTLTVGNGSIREFLHFNESITIAHIGSRIGHHNVSTYKPSLSKEERLRLYKLQLGGERRQSHGHFEGVCADVVYDDSEDEDDDNSKDEDDDNSDDEEQLRQYKLQLGGSQRQRHGHYEGVHDHAEDKVYDNAEEDGFMTIQKNMILTMPDI